MFSRKRPRDTTPACFSLWENRVGVVRADPGRGKAASFRVELTDPATPTRPGDATADVRTMTCLSPDDLTYFRMELPTMPREELASAVGWQLARQDASAEKVKHHGYHDLGPNGGPGRAGRSVIAVTAQPEAVRRRQSVAKGLGGALELAGDQTGLLARHFQSLGSEATMATRGQRVAVVNVGRSRTAVMVLDGDRLLDARTLLNGTGWIDEQVQRLGGSDPKPTRPSSDGTVPNDEVLLRVCRLLLKQWEQELRIATHQIGLSHGGSGPSTVGTIGVYAPRGYAGALTEAVRDRRVYTAVDLRAALRDEHAASLAGLADDARAEDAVLPALLLAADVQRDPRGEA